MTCEFCGTAPNPGERSCATYAQATAKTSQQPYGCPWFDEGSRRRFAMPIRGGWRRIELAPQDGTQIIVCSRYSEDVAIVRWDARKKDWICLADGIPVIESQGDWGTDYLYFSVPSHWRPCPAALVLLTKDASNGKLPSETSPISSRDRA